jgi:hypothetical protein
VKKLALATAYTVTRNRAVAGRRTLLTATYTRLP